MILTFEEIKNTLIQAGLKATHPRIVIYKTLLELEAHPTAERIYEAIHINNPSISLGTVYKNLDILLAKQLIKKVNSPEGSMRYDANLGIHHHIYCDNTQEIIDFEDNELNQLIENYLKNKNLQNLQVQSIQIQIHGNKIDLNQQVTIKTESN